MRERNQEYPPRMRMMKIRLVAIMSLAFAVAPLCAIAVAQTPASATHTIEVNGNGQSQAAPDLATLEVTIETHAPTAADAAGSNGHLAQKVRDALQEKLGDKGMMWTGGYSLYPEYNEPRNGGKPTITGYRAENSITVETGSLDLVGPLIDAAIAAGANRVNSLDYSLRENSKARSDAITKASKDAQTQAEALAAALRLKLGPIVRASTVAEIRPVLARGVAMGASIGAPTPIEPGQVTVPATVSLTYEIQ
jgi:uncharacterized protein